MSVSSSASPKKRTRVLFLAWGFSIHAKRRIQIFVDDPSFEVIIASTCNYRFRDALNISLSGAHEEEHIPKGACLEEGDRATGKSSRKSLEYFVQVLSLIREIPGGLKLIFRGWHILAPILSSDDRSRLGGLKGVGEFFLSSDMRHEVVRASRDLKILKRTVRESKPDIIFLQTLLYPCYLAFLLPQSFPIMITFWNGDLTWWAEWSGIERKLKKALVAYGVRRARAITVNSTSAFNACVECGAEREKIRLIRYPGIDLSRFTPSAKGQAKIKLGIDFEKVVLWPRGLGSYLNSDVIIEAIPMVIRKHPNTLFLFVSGNGKEQEWQKHLQRVKEFGFERNVRWDGNVPWELMARYYNASDVMVSISSNDSLPNCMLEAMACGIPIVMGDILSIREWVTDGVNGFLVPPRDPVAVAEKILRALDDPGNILMSFVEKNLELARCFFDSEQNGQEIKRLVQDIAGYNGEKPPARHS
jgi:glycosyltransferase involved in cell wall biosynthesis